MSDNKIAVTRHASFAGTSRPRRLQQIPNSRRRAKVESEKRLIEALLRDDENRAALMRGMGIPEEPFLVWNEIDPRFSETEVLPSMLPKWKSLSQYIKLFVGFDIGRETGEVWSFTSQIAPSLLQKWKSGGSDLMDNIEQRLRRSLAGENLRRLEFAYVVETKDKSGRFSVRPHLHGYVILYDSNDKDRFRRALSNALFPHGSRAKDIDIQLGYDLKGDRILRSRWISYITKNVSRWDAIIAKKRIFISRPLNEVIRSAWELRKEKFT